MAHAFAQSEAPNMTKNSKIYLTLSLVLLGVGIMAIVTRQADAMPLLYVPLPVGAVMFGLFLVSRVIGKEAEHFAEEQHQLEQATDSQARKH